MSVLTRVSVPNLLRVAIPMMLMAMSTNMMYFCDRFFLARYSLEDMNAVAAASLLCATFQFVAIGIAAIVEVFVGQYNGAGSLHKIGNAVWQMIWFSVLAQLFFIPMAFVGEHILIAEDVRVHGLGYYKIIMFFGGLPAFSAALAGFFVGRGQAGFVAIAAGLANVINIGLNYILIFGWEPFIPSLGAEGSAIATVISSVFQVVLMAGIFLNKKNRKNYHTQNYLFNAEIFKRCLFLGAPSAIGHGIEIFAWTTIAQMLALKGSDYITIHNIASLFFLLFCFITEGMQKGVIAIASNLIGANLSKDMPKLFKTGLAVHVGVLWILALPLLVYPHVILAWIINAGDAVDPQAVYLALKFVWCYFAFDGLVWIIAGILTAAGDTRFIMVINALTAWLFAVLPVYIGVTLYGINPALTWLLIVIYACINFCMFWARYQYGSWRKLQLS